MIKRYYAGISANTGGSPTPPLTSVNLSLTNGRLIATVSGGTAPYTYNFRCDVQASPGGCSSYNIVNPNQSTYLTSTGTNFSYAAYASAVYNFSCIVTDSNGNIIISNIISEAPCLVPETLIKISDTLSKTLDEVQVNERIFGNENYIISKKYKKVNELYILNGGILKMSAQHVNIINNSTLVTAENLKEGDILIGEVVISSIEIVKGDFTVIDIATSEHTYTANGILTHNKLPC